MLLSANATNRLRRHHRTRCRRRNPSRRGRTSPTPPGAGSTLADTAGGAVIVYVHSGHGNEKLLKR